MERITGTCPGCRKRCDLATPRCHVGEAYAKTGMLPSDKKKEKKEHPKDEAVRLTEAGRQNDVASEDRRLADTLRVVSRALRHGEGTLDALSAEEKAQLGALIEKAWAGMESEHRGHQDHHGHHGHREHDEHRDHHGHHEHGEHHDNHSHHEHDEHHGHREHDEHHDHHDHHGHDEHHDHHDHHGHDEHHDHHGHCEHDHHSHHEHDEHHGHHGH